MIRFPFRVHFPLVLLGAALIAASPAFGETLEEALAKAYTTNPELLSQRAALKASDEEVPQALSNWRPELELTGQAGHERTDTERSLDTTDPRLVELTVTQPIYRGGRTVADTRRAEADVRAARAELHSTEQSVLLSAVRAYMDVVRDEAVVELNRANEQRLERQLQAARDRFRVGEITRTDVAQAEARLSRANADRIQAEGALAATRETYRRIIGDAPGRLTRPGVTLDLPANAEASSSRAREQNPDVVRAVNRAESATHTVRVVKGELLPTFEIQGALTAERDPTASIERRESAVILGQLTVPIYQQGAVYSRLRAARHVQSQRREELDNVRRGAVEAATTAWNDLQTARAAVTSFEAEVRANEIALDGVQREALVGSRTVLDVLDAEQELLDAKVNLVRSQRDELVAQFELLAAVGALTARELKLPVPIYDAEANYKNVRDRWFGGTSGE